LLDAFADDELRDVGEVIVEIDRDPLPRLLEGLAALAARAPQLAIRLALPLVTRQWEVRGIAQKIAALREAGWRKWEAANLSAWEFLGVDPTPGSRREGGPDLAADWSVYVLNRMAARQALDMGASGFTLSPEDGWENLRSLLREFGAAATVVVYQDTPLFISESCAWAGLRQRCAGASRCRFDGLDLDSSRGEAITVANRHCRTTAFSRSPFCLADRVAELVAGGARRVRADFVCRPYTAAEGTRIWRLLRTGAAPAGCHAGNFARGLA
jgi:hypothetical protein